ncbi:cupin domain-containing protein [Burkholderia theae]|uniref:cupin domain-containing protein n=1 Tax=Burkholderia theae TaxID=3143496 RepID=UPI003AFAEAB5
MNRAFSAFELNHGPLAVVSTDTMPTSLFAWNDEAVLDLPADGTHFGFVYGGTAVLQCAAGRFELQPGMYFCVPGRAKVSGGGGGIVVSRHDYSGFFQLGGPIEPWGRLKYIDGCTDSLLIPPVQRGDACLNLLCFPPGIRQTSHTHPSVRVGIVASGSGECVTPDGVIALCPGKAFVIHEEQLHAFVTHDDSLRVIAYHPDSDFGPTHEDHPMINRTMVNGVSAAELEAIRTR